jgi:hypothetical protein
MENCSIAGRTEKLRREIELIQQEERRYCNNRSHSLTENAEHERQEFRVLAIREELAVTHDTVTISPVLRFRAAMILAIIADALQIVVFPLFVEGALSPADDIVDFGVAAVLVNLIGWHWEFLPSFFAKLVPGVDLIPFWTMAVLSVHRKWKQTTTTVEETREQHPALRDPQSS